MNIDQIPDFFNLLGHQIRVSEDDTLTYERDAEGITCYFSNTITLANNDRKYKTYPESNKKVTFLHELVHLILYYMGKKDLECDEEFVDLFAQLLYQAMSTSVCFIKNEKDTF